MDFQKIMKEKQISIPTNNFTQNEDPDGSVLAWSGYVLVTKSSRVKEEDTVSDTLSIFPTQA